MTERVSIQNTVEKQAFYNKNNLHIQPLENKEKYKKMKIHIKEWKRMRDL